MGFFDSIGDFLFGSDDEEQTTTQKVENAPSEFVKQPEYPEAEGARGLWWDKLQQWSGMPGYGAIQPDWGDIWNRVEQKIRQSYWGGPMTPGAVSRVRSSAARRNVSQSPAMEELIGRMGVQESQDIGNAATEQAWKEALLGEQGRTTWLNSIIGLSGMKPSGSWYTPSTTQTTTAPYQTEGAIGPLLGMAGQMIGQSQQSDWLSSIMKQFGTGGGEGGENAIGEGKGAWGQFDLPSSILGDYGFGW